MRTKRVVLRTSAGRDVAGHDLDECRCGDYRRDHLGGWGPCRYNQPRDLTHGRRNCERFRLATRYRDLSGSIRA